VVPAQDPEAMAEAILHLASNEAKRQQFIKELGYRILEAAEAGNIDEIGEMFHQHWQYKKRISAKMTTPEFDRIYDAAIEYGALGGKISGAGGGGFLTFYVPGSQKAFRVKMREFNLREMRYHFDYEGTKVLSDS